MLRLRVPVAQTGETFFEGNRGLESKLTVCDGNIREEPSNVAGARRLIDDSRRIPVGDRCDALREIPDTDLGSCSQIDGSAHK